MNGVCQRLTGTWKSPLLSSTWPHLLRGYVCVSVCVTALTWIWYVWFPHEGTSAQSMRQAEKKSTLRAGFIHLFHLSVIFYLTVTLNLEHRHWYLSVWEKQRKLCYWLQFATTGQRVNMCKRNLIARCGGGKWLRGLQGALTWYNTLSQSCNGCKELSLISWEIEQSVLQWKCVIHGGKVVQVWLQVKKERSVCGFWYVWLLKSTDFESIQQLWCVSLQIWK